MTENTEQRRKQRNVFFGIPILGFFRSNFVRQVDVRPETRPLIVEETEFVEETETSTVTFAEEPPRRRKTAKELWAVLRSNVRKETFHIQDWRTKSERIRTREQERHFSEMELPYEFSVWACVGAWCVYLGISVLAYSFIFEHWTVIESMYFANVSFTTIGYGDLSPTTRGGRVFCCFFALAGVCVLGIALGIVGSKVIEGEVETLEKAEKKMTKDVFKIFSRDNGTPTLRHSSSSLDYLSDSLGSNFRQDMEDKNACKQTLSWWRSLCVLLFKYTPALAPLFLGAFLIAKFEGWAVDETVYYMVVTSTTIGYGDYVPERDSMKLLAVFYIPLAVGAMGHFLGTIANFIIDQRRQKYDKKLWRHEITLEDLAAMDEDDDGVVTELEFLVFMLVAMKKVDKELTDRIREHFHHLDLSNSGTLVREDLELMAKKKLRSARTKLRLQQYKARLTSFSEESEHQYVSFQNEV